MDNQDVGGGGSQGAAGQEDQNVSGQTQKPIEGDAPAWLSELKNEFTGRIEGLSKELRGLQGRQDRSDNQQSEFRNQLAKFNQYKAQDMSDDEALAEMEADDRSETRWKTLEQKLDDLAKRLESGAQANTGNAAAKVFEAIGLDPKDPRVAAALTKRYENADQVELAAYRLQRELAQTPNPSGAQGAALQGGSTSQTDYNALAAEYEQLMVDPGANFQRLTEIQKELEKIK